MKLRRLQLYELVWRTPLTALAKEAGVSDSAIGKACRIHDVPRPGRGYWRKLETGQTPARTPIAAPDRDEETSIVVRDSLLQTLEEASEGPALPRARRTAAITGDRETASEDHSQRQAKSLSMSTAPRPSDPQESDSQAGELLLNDPTLHPAAVLELAHDHARQLEANRLLDDLQDALSNHNAGVRALGVLWRGRAREILAKADPVARLVKALEQAAATRADSTACACVFPTSGTGDRATGSTPSPGETANRTRQEKT